MLRMLNCSSQSITAPLLLRLLKQPAGSRESSHVSCSVAQVEGLPGLRVRQLLVSMPVLAAQETLRRFSGKNSTRSGVCGVNMSQGQLQQTEFFVLLIPVESTACCNPSQEHLHSRQGLHIREVVVPAIERTMSEAEDRHGISMNSPPKKKINKNNIKMKKMKKKQKKS